MACPIALAALLLVPFKISASPAGNRSHVEIRNIERANLYFSFGKNENSITEGDEWADTTETAAAPFRKCRRLLRGFISRVNNKLDRLPGHSNVSNRDALVHAERMIGKLNEVLKELDHHENKPLTHGRFNWTMEKIVAKLDLILEQMERIQNRTYSNKDEVRPTTPKEITITTAKPTTAKDFWSSPPSATVDDGLSSSGDGLSPSLPATTDDVRRLPSATTKNTQSSSTVMTEGIHSLSYTTDESIQSSPQAVDGDIRWSPISKIDDIVSSRLAMTQDIRASTLRGGEVVKVTTESVGSQELWTVEDIESLLPTTEDPVAREVSTAGIPNSAVCSGVYCGMYSGEQGTILSPGWPGYYTNHVLCNIRISAPAGHVVTLLFHSFLLEYDDGCSYDYLKIYDGSSMTASLLGTFCGSTRPDPVLASGSEVYMQFKTDASVTNRGFDIEYIASTGGCNKTYNSHFGRILSPRWPDEYPNNMLCNIKVKTGNRITLSFNYFRLESHDSCNYDYLKIFNGGTSSAPLLTSLCGDQRPGSQQSPGKELFMVFKTDGSGTYKGFDMVYVSRSD